MLNCFKQLLRDESGLVITAELIMIVTIAVIGLTAGWGAVTTMLAGELEDVANSVGSLDQSYNYRGLTAWGHATCSGSGFNDVRNVVNVSTGSESVAGYTYTQIAPQYEVVEQEVLEEEVLIEEDVVLDLQIDEVVLVQLVELGIVQICEDGTVVLLREDLIEICEDGSIIILEEAIQQEATERQLVEPEVILEGAANQHDEAHQHRPVDIEELRHENAQLRKRIEKLSGETKFQ